MPQESNAPDTSVNTMQDFFSKYGAEEALGELDTGESPEQRRQPQQTQSSSPQSQDSGEEESGLDADTLQALGLIPGEEQPASPPADDEKTGTESQTPEIDLTALASTLGLDADDLSLKDGKPMVKAKVDGEVMEVSLSELRKGYQLQSHFNRQNEAFLQERQQWEQARQQQEQQLVQQSGLAMEVLQAEEKQLQQDYTRNWNQLRTEDPAEYAAQVAEYNQKLQKIRQRQQDLVSSVQQRQVEQQQVQMQQLQQLRQQNVQYLAEHLGWKDEETFRKGADDLRKYLAEGVGLQSAEIDGIFDPRTLIVADKARRYDELMSKVEIARKKVTESHKMPTGTGLKPDSGKKGKIRASMARLQKTHSLEAAADVFDKIGILN